MKCQCCKTEIPEEKTPVFKFNQFFCSEACAGLFEKKIYGEWNDLAEKAREQQSAGNP